MKRIQSFAEVAPLIKPGATIVLHSGFAEPERLTRELAEQAPALGGVRIVTCMGMGPAPYADAALVDHVRLGTYVPGKAWRSAVGRGRAALLRTRLSHIPALYDDGGEPADVLLLQLSPPDAEGRMYLGPSVDFMPAVLRRKPIVVAELHPGVPRTSGATVVPAEAVDFVLDGTAGPWTISASEGAEEADRRIADHVAGLIGHGSTIQAGIGAIPDLVLERLAALHGLGLHSGIITNAVRPLIERGVVTGRTVTTMAGGDRAFYDFLDGNPDVVFLPCDQTHDVRRLARIENLCAINSVLEIDLAGRGNAERLDGRTISGPGGLPDFAEGAAAAPGGRSIIALRATSRDGSVSRIRPALAADAPVTVGPEHVGFVVTEFGVARLAGLGAGDRARALVELAHPDFRGELARAAAML